MKALKRKLTMKRACWFVAIAVAVCILVLSLSGCAFLQSTLGPTPAEKDAADTNKDGLVDEQERTAAGLPVDTSPWIRLGLQLGGAFIPGLGAASLAYRKMQEHREALRSVVVGVENFKGKLSTGTVDPDALKQLLIHELSVARDSISKNPERLSEFVKSVTQKPAETPKG